MNRQTIDITSNNSMPNYNLKPLNKKHKNESSCNIKVAYLIYNFSRSI